MGSPFSSSPPAGDRRWQSNSPLRPLLGLLTTSLLLLVVHASSWIGLAVNHAGSGSDLESFYYGIGYCSCPSARGAAVY